MVPFQYSIEAITIANVLGIFTLTCGGKFRQQTGRASHANPKLASGNDCVMLMMFHSGVKVSP